MNIVIIDNNLGLLRSLQLLLDREGHHVIPFSAPSEGLFYFVREKDIDVLLIDYSMPEMNGDEFVTLLKKEIPTKCRIVMMSAHNPNPIEMKRLGIQTFLEKPIDLEQLKSSLMKQPEPEGVQL